MPLIPLREWGDRLPVPPSTETLRRWHRDSKIYPPSSSDGYRIMVEETAVKINPTKPENALATPAKCSLTSRIKHGRTEKKP
ncbi:excisionase [Pantoea sp. BAV 3049]|uniref:excisionase n=1 Tax=Pantoea sp. BAV 3049 TaxID=2654188 RepID=UPI00131BD034|nr:excisionase [Pantoea sp. BAV 3049]